MDCHIRAFGACMIGGFPHRPEDSFFYKAIECLQKQGGQKPITSQFTFGGFPVTRVPKHLRLRCLDFHPNIVVLQFGTSDLIVPIRRHHHHDSRPVHRNVSIANPVLIDRLRWQIQSLVGDAFGLAPVTDPTVYLQTVEQIARSLAEQNIIPVVLSPFVFGGRRSDRIARDCAVKLKQRMAQVPKAVFVDAYTALNEHPRSRMLLRDGSHLSIQGHLVVADALFPHLKNLLDNFN